MTRPWLSVVIPTVGRDTLAATLRSICTQTLKSEVEVLVIGDAHKPKTANDHEGALARAADVCGQYDVQFLRHDGGVNAWGHPQRNYGQSIAHGDWIVYTQDDDAYCVGAFQAMYNALQKGAVYKDGLPYGIDFTPAPHIFKFATWQAGVIWAQPRVRLGNVDADMIAVPNAPKRLQRWTNEYAGDFAFIEATVDEYDGAVIWQDVVIGQGRPDQYARRRHGVPPVAS